MRAYVLEQGGNWDSYLPLAEFTYKNNFYSSIGMTLFEALYGRRCMIPWFWYDSGESVVLGPEIVQQTIEKVNMIQEKMKASQSRQKSCLDKKRKALEFQDGYHVFLRVSLLIGVGRALMSQKLMPHFIGLYHILQRVGEMA